MFLVNLPLGMLALVVTGAALRLPVVRLQSEDSVRSNDRLWSEDQRAPQIDYLGAGLVFASVSALVLALAWAGPEHGWTHPTTVSLAAAGVVLVALLVVCESRVAEPILPLRLFTNRVFATTSAVAGIVGVGMFGTVVMMPLYLQIITGTSATGAGSRLLPFVFGYIATSIVSGRQISRTGSYRAFPIAGTALTALGLGLLSLIDAATPGWLLALDLLAVGGGLGLTIQPLLVAVQTAVEPSDMGIATSANVFFRSFGSTIGTALFAAIFTSRLGENLAHTFATLTTSSREALAGIDARSLMANAERIKTLPIELQQSVLAGFAGAFHAVFLLAVAIALVGTVVALFTGPSVRRPMTAAGAEAAGAEAAAA
jgi:MFS family permease